MIHQFYAVTETSVYFVKDRRTAGDPSPVAEKIALKGASALPVGGKLSGQKMRITRWLKFYSAENWKRGETDSEISDGGTSEIVALFLERDQAMSCFSSESKKARDGRWLASTLEVLEKIGAEHPVFIVSKSGKNSLMET